MGPVVFWAQEGGCFAPAERIRESKKFLRSKYVAVVRRLCRLRYCSSLPKQLNFGRLARYAIGIDNILHWYSDNLIFLRLRE